MFIENNFYVGFRDVNFLQELTNTSLLANLENTAGIHSCKANNGINQKSTWVLLAWKVHIIKRPKFNDTIKVKTWSREIQKIYAYRDFKVYDENNNVICIATSKWVYIDLEKGKIVKVSPEVEKAYESELVYSFDENEREFGKLKEPEKYDSYIEFKITRNMIDTNHHLHNIYYLDIAKEAIPEKYFLNKEFNDFEIMYKKEIKCGDTVKAFYTEENGKHIVTIKSLDESELHAIVLLK